MFSDNLEQNTKEKDESMASCSYNFRKRPSPLLQDEDSNTDSNSLDDCDGKLIFHYSYHENLSIRIICGIIKLNNSKV